MRTLLDRALADPERGIADPPAGRPTRRSSCSPARSGGDARIALSALERAVETARGREPPGRPRRRRGRAPAQGAQLRPRRRPPLRLHLRLDQGHPGLGPRRLPLLPGGDARGRRGPPVHRQADGDPRLRGRRQRRPAGARGRRRPPPRRWTGWACPSAASTSPRRPTYLALAPKSNASYRGIQRATAHVREHGAKPPPAYLRDAHYPGRTQAGPRDRLRLPARRAGRRRRPAGDPGRASRASASTSRPTAGAEAELGRRLEEIRRRLASPGAAQARKAAAPGHGASASPALAGCAGLRRGPGGPCSEAAGGLRATPDRAAPHATPFARARHHGGP